MAEQTGAATSMKRPETYSTSSLEEALNGLLRNAEAVREQVGREIEAAGQRWRLHYEEKLASERLAASRRISEHFNQVGRRLREAETERQWAGVLVDGVGAYAKRVALFSVQEGAVKLTPTGTSFEPIEIPLADSPALASAVETRQPVVTLFSAGQLSSALVKTLVEPAGTRVYLLPLVPGDRVSHVLSAEGDEEHMDLNALEHICLVGALAWSIKFAAKYEGAGQPAALGRVAREAEQAGTLDWAGLTREDQDLHLRAQRFARVQVAEIRLYKSQEVRQGRLGRNLYAVLRSEIDSGREAFRQQFLGASPTMVDYFHEELVKTLAHRDASLLGEEYPGPLA